MRSSSGSIHSGRRDVFPWSSPQWDQATLCPTECNTHLAGCRPRRDERLRQAQQPSGCQSSWMEVFSYAQEACDWACLTWALPAADREERKEGEGGGGCKREREGEEVDRAWVSPLFIHQTLSEREAGIVTEVYGAVWMDQSLGYSVGGESGGGQLLAARSRIILTEVILLFNPCSCDKKRRAFSWSHTVILQLFEV